MAWVSYNFHCKKCNKDFETIVNKETGTDKFQMPECPNGEGLKGKLKHKVERLANAFATYDIRGGGSTKSSGWMK